MQTENLNFTRVLTPVAGTADGTVFTVGRRSVVSRLVPSTGAALGVDDAFELHTVLDFNKQSGAPVASYAVKEGGEGIFMGTNRTQVETLIRGVYVWKKILATTPLVGVENADGYEKVL